MKSTTYFCKLRLLSPVHIGCDEVYEPTGFALDEQDGTLISFEPLSFLAGLDKQELVRFSAICRKGTVASLLEIYKFIRQHKDHAEGQQVAVSSAFIEHYNRVLRLRPEAVQQQLNKFLVARTAFQPVTVEPYIPGSAIKGAVRTAVLNLRNNGSRQPRFRGRNAGRELQEHLLQHNGRKMETDPFRLVKIGDFHPVGTFSQRIVYAVNRKKRPSRHEARGPYQMLEVVETGAEFVGPVTVQEKPDGADIREPVTIDEIRRALAAFYSRELEREQQVLQGIGCAQTVQPSDQDKTVMLRLGRHSGAESVTVEGHRHIRIMQARGMDPVYKDHATTIWLAADAENPSSNQNLRPFGWTELSFLSSRDAEEYKKISTDKYRAREEKQQELLIRHREKLEELARQRELERAEQERLQAEQRQREEEERKYPWRKLLAGLDGVDNWDALKNRVLENESFISFQAEKEIGQAVAEAARRVAGASKKKWTAERDEMVAGWLQASGLTWESMATKKEETVHPLFATIRGWKNPADFDRTIDLKQLDRECCIELQNLFRKWSWNRKNKAKEANHQLWKDLQDRLKQLKNQ